jgi:hypothetical protein
VKGKGRWGLRALSAVCGVALCGLVTPAWCGTDADRWLDGDHALARSLADQAIAFEDKDDAAQPPAVVHRFAGEWALVTHQMTALGLAQLCLAHPEDRAALAPQVTRAALKSFRREMRRFGTDAWGGEDAMASLGGSHGHAYLGYAALAIGMARMLDPAFPADVARQHDALIAAYERRLLASPTGLIETYPGEAYPTDTAAVAGAIAVHGRATGTDHAKVLAHWVAMVKKVQIHPASGFVYQRMDAATGKPHDAPRGSGTALAAYFAGFADRGVARQLAEGVLRHEATVSGFSGIREYADGTSGAGDIDSGPVVLGVSVAATGFALAPARAHGYRAAFERLYRTTDLFGAPESHGGRLRFRSGGAFGDAFLLAMLTSGPELAP